MYKINIDVAKDFLGFFKGLSKTREDDMDNIKKINNGFENWIKIEFYLWLIKEKGLKPEDDVGVEYEVELNDKKNKRCDLWYRGNNDGGFNYIEFKNVFNNNNKNKMFEGVRKDFDCMSKIAPCNGQDPSTGSAVVIGVNFNYCDVFEREIRKIDQNSIVRNESGICVAIITKCY